ncbi:MAG: 50S ribosomal protein L11 methyltransferase [Chitinispirillaceae bacterium]
MPAYCLYVTITEEQREIANAIGYSHGMNGCVERQGQQGIELGFYFGQQQEAEAARASFSSMLSAQSQIEFIEDQDWNARWRESMEPAQIAPGVWVSPLWLEPPQEDRSIWIKIEPKMAFGTGHHETTRLAARELISSREQIDRKRLLDIGTGSGVLCFIADYMGSAFSLGVEIDQDCRENLAENKRDNPPSGKVAFTVGTLDSLKSNASFDTVVMNMLSTESEPLLGRVSLILQEGGQLIWSGILTSEQDEVVSKAREFGLKLAGVQTENEWWCGRFVKG